MADEAEKRRLRREARQKKILSNADDRLAKFSAPSTGGEEGEGEVETPTLTLDETRIPQFVNTEEAEAEGGTEEVGKEGGEQETQTETQAADTQTESGGSELRRRHQGSSGPSEPTIDSEPIHGTTPPPAPTPTPNAATAAAQAAHEQDEERKRERARLARTRQKYSVGMAVFMAVMVWMRLWGGSATTAEERRECLYALLFGGVAKGPLQHIPSIVSMFLYCELAMLAKQYLDSPRVFLPSRPPAGATEGANVGGLMSNIEQLGTLWWLAGTVWSDVCVFVFMTVLLLCAPLVWWGLPPLLKEEPYAS